MKKFLISWIAVSLVLLGLLMLVHWKLPGNLPEYAQFMYMLLIVVAGILVALTQNKENE